MAPDIQIDEGEYVDDGLEWWEMPKPVITPEKLARWKAERIAKAEREREWRILEKLRIQASKLLPELAERDGRSCKHCGTTEKLTVDHIVPRSRGGTNDINNLQILCRACNSRKGAR